MISFYDVQPLRDGHTLHEPVNLTVKPGEILCIIGASGVGKTSLLDAVRGQIAYHGRIDNKGELFSVYQSDNQMFPWFSIIKNFELAKCKNWQQWVEKWKLDHLLHKSPRELSSGQRQRLVLIRALSTSADLLLCDEPLNNLDSLGSKNIAQDFRDAIKQKKQTSAIWITHDLIEAKLIADVTCVMTARGLITIPRDKINFEHVKQYLV